MSLTLFDVITVIVSIPAFLVAGLTVYCVIGLAKELITNRR